MIPYCLAIETSAPPGSLSLGLGDDLLATIPLWQPRRHNVELAAAIGQLCKDHGASRQAIGQVYLSIGPGSFTGLRIGIATVKMLAMALDIKVVAVPTIDVVAHNAPADRPHIAVCLNTKRDQAYTGFYERRGDRLAAAAAPQLMTAPQVCEKSPRPLAVIAAKPLDHPWPGDIEILEPHYAQPDSRIVWQLGRAAAAQGSFADPMTLTPLYARAPEAETLWQKRQEQAGRA